MLCYTTYLILYTILTRLVYKIYFYYFPFSILVEPPVADPAFYPPYCVNFSFSYIKIKQYIPIASIVTNRTYFLLYLQHVLMYLFFRCPAFFSDSAVGAVPSGHAVAQVAASSVPALLPEPPPVQSVRLLPAGGIRDDFYVIK